MPPPPAVGRRLVLVVEDNPSIAETLEYFLNDDGFDVVIAATGPQGLAQFEAMAPDLVLLDLMLPGLNGLEVCHRIRARSTVPILIVTARADAVEKVVGLEAGADDYLTKPFAIAELRARINAVMRRRGVPRPRPHGPDS
jgi:two-component system, OmpR family, response regulator RegX3